MSDDEIRAFRDELLADRWARGTDAPYACARALAVARGARQKAAKTRARATVIAAYQTWIASGRDGMRATLADLEAGRPAQQAVRP